MKIMFLVSAIIALLLFPACGGGGGGDEDAISFAGVREVVAALDKHTLSDEYRPRIKVGTDEAFAGTSDVLMHKYTLYGADAGSGFIVEPGSYGVEIYIYKDRKTAIDFASDLGATGNHIHSEGNVTLVLSTSTEADLSRLVADLLD